MAALDRAIRRDFQAGDTQILADLRDALVALSYYVVAPDFYENEAIWEQDTHLPVIAWQSRGEREGRLFAAVSALLERREEGR